MPRIARVPDCHPDRQHCAKGLCKSCYYRRREKRLRATDEGRGKVREMYRRCRLRKKFGITVGEYDAMLAQQGGVCAICGNPPQTRKLAVDHCHATGAIRGLLCINCNRAIGLLRDSPPLIRAAAQYLEHRRRRGAA